MACALEPHTPLPSALQVHPKVAQELRRAELPHVQGPCDRAARAGRPRAGRRREHGRRSAAVGQHGGRAMVAHLTKPDLAGAGVGGLGGARVRGKVPGRFQAAQKRGVVFVLPPCQPPCRKTMAMGSSGAGRYKGVGSVFDKREGKLPGS
jgi:hypothetical protein